MQEVIILTRKKTIRTFQSQTFYPILNSLHDYLRHLIRHAAVLCVELHDSIFARAC